MSIGTSECFTSSDPCGSALKGVAGALTNKPLVHVVEVSFTWETRGPYGYNKEESCHTFSFWMRSNSRSRQFIQQELACCSSKGKQQSIADSHSPLCSGA